MQAKARSQQLMVREAQLVADTASLANSQRQSHHLAEQVRLGQIWALLWF